MKRRGHEKSRSDGRPAIRRATTEDAELLADLGRQTFVDAFESDNDSGTIAEYVAGAFSPERLRAEIEDAESEFLIASRDGEAVGYAKTRTAPAPASVAGRAPVEIERIYATSDTIGTGVGAALMTRCLELAKQRGSEVVWLGVWERNERAIRFYERWGFTVVGEKTFGLGGETQRDVVMVREVS